jgi:predicted permease
MRARHRLLVWLRSWFRPSRLDVELCEELQFHLERQIEAHVQDGMAPTEARRAAHLALGGADVVREISREARAGALAHQWIRDLAYGLRLARRTPLFSLTCVAIVALAVGATTAIFSVVYGVTLRPLPYRDPARLVTVWMRYPQLNVGRAFVNAADHRDWQARNHVFDEIGLVRPIVNFNLTGEGEPERVFAARVTAATFRVLGIAPAVGRSFVDEEDVIGRDRVVLLSDGLWKRRYGADRSIVGRAISLSGVLHTVVGVMSPDFQYPSRDTQVWTPLTIDSDELSRVVPANNYLAVARLQPGVMLAQAQAEMDGINRQLIQEYAKTGDGGRLAAGFWGAGSQPGIEVVPLLEDTIGAVRRPLYVLLGAVSCLLLIGCLNLANLVGARAASRTREFAVRLALGASRGRLVQQALVEVVPMVLGGGLAGGLLARAGLAAFVPFAPTVLPRVESISVSPPVMLFSCGLLVVTALVAGMLPAVQAWRSNSATITQEDNRSLAGGSQQTRTRAVLVIAQVALVLPLLVGAGLLTRTFVALTHVDPGFHTENRQTLQFAIPRSKYPRDPDVAAFCTRLVERVRDLPGVVSVGMVNRLPLGGVGQVNLLEFDTAAPVKPIVSSDTRTVTPDYFRTMGIPVVEGRAFTIFDRDTVPTTRFGAMPTVGIIDEQIARTMWPGESAIGKRLRWALESVPWIEIVGVVGHIHHDGLDSDPRPQVYFNYLQRAQDRMAMVVLSDTDTRPLRPAILQAIRTVDPDQPVYDVRLLEAVVDQSVAQRWLNMVLVTAFAILALALASIGVYGVIAYGVANRRREFGIRLALGARRGDILRLVVRTGIGLVLTGMAAGLLGALVLTRAIQSLLFGVQPRDLASFAAAAAIMFAVAVLASYLPARRAASVDPAQTLRAE